MSQINFDVLIVGAGVAGATLACALGNQDLRVGLIDRAARPEWPEGSDIPGNIEYDARVSAINIASQRTLAALGAWDAILERRHQPFHAMRVWDEAGDAATYFDATTIGECAFGTIAENRVATRALLDRASQFDNISLHFESQLTAIHGHADHVELTLASGQTMRTRLLTGADGGRSYVRQQTDIQMPFKDYQQRTLVGTVRTENDHENTAWQRFLATGPCALLPLAPNVCSLAWHADVPVSYTHLTLPTTPYV